MMWEAYIHSMFPEDSSRTNLENTTHNIIPYSSPDEIDEFPSLRSLSRVSPTRSTSRKKMNTKLQVDDLLSRYLPSETTSNSVRLYGEDQRYSDNKKNNLPSSNIQTRMATTRNNLLPTSIRHCETTSADCQTYQESVDEVLKRYATSPDSFDTRNYAKYKRYIPKWEYNMALKVEEALLMKRSDNNFKSVAKFQ